MIVRIYDLVAHLQRQTVFSLRAFGPGKRTKGIVAHIKKELAEIERDPTDLKEWIDVALLAFDGAWRHGHSAEAVAVALGNKLYENERRTWPDWREASEDAPIEHHRQAAEGVAGASKRFTDNELKEWMDWVPDAETRQAIISELLAFRAAIGTPEVAKEVVAWLCRDIICPGCGLCGFRHFPDCRYAVLLAKLPKGAGK